jgi:hypothetical protein
MGNQRIGLCVYPSVNCLYLFPTRLRIFHHLNWYQLLHLITIEECLFNANFINYHY